MTTQCMHGDLTILLRFLIPWCLCLFIRELFPCSCSLDAAAAASASASAASKILRFSRRIVRLLSSSASDGQVSVLREGGAEEGTLDAGGGPEAPRLRREARPWQLEESEFWILSTLPLIFALIAGLQRCGKSCRLRWTNYLRPDIKRGEFSLQEEQTIIQLHALLGNRWSAIATHLPKRTDNEIKNYWNTHLKKRLAKMGIDPSTHKAKSDALSSTGDGGGHSRGAANLSHMAQWESARLEAEARLVRESKLRTGSCSSAILQQMGPASSSSSTAAPPPHPGCLDVLRAGHGQLAAAIDLESPTSTLSFADNRVPIAVADVGLADGNAAGIGHQEGENLEQERIDSFAGFSAEAFSGGGDTPWLSETYAMQGAGCAWGQFGAGFTGMLLGDKISDCVGDSFGDGHETCIEDKEEEDKEGLMQGEENKSYWNSILNSVNSSSSSTSPPVFYD